MWLPPPELREQRELPRTRMALCAWRTSIKNRIQSVLAKYALAPNDGLKVFSQHGRAWLQEALRHLPPETGRCLTPTMQVLKSLPGVGDILAIVIEREVGRIERFPTCSAGCQLQRDHPAGELQRRQVALWTHAYGKQSVPKVGLH